MDPDLASDRRDSRVKKEGPTKVKIKHARGDPKLHVNKRRYVRSAEVWCEIDRSRTSKLTK